MAMELASLINKSVFSWALQRAGKSQLEVSKKFPKINDWILGKITPTIKQMEVYSKSLYFPFGYFFLDAIPNETPTIPFFRAKNQNQSNDINILDEIKIVKAQQEWISDYLQSEGLLPLDIVGLCKNNNETDVLQKMTTILNVPFGFGLNFNTSEQAIDFFTKKLQDANINVVFNGKVGDNTNRTIKVDECRGFCLLDKYAPYIFINSADSKCAQLFTLLHETAHIFIGYESGFGYEDAQECNLEAKEKLCDAVAANFLVPKDALLELYKTEKDSAILSKKFCVSQIVILRRMLNVGAISKNEFYQALQTYKFNIITLNPKKSTGGNFYATKKKQLGERLLRSLDSAIKENKISITQAYNLTGLKKTTFDKVMEGL